MLKKTIPYEDYNETKREEDFYFNLTETELAEMQLEVTGGLDTMLQAIIKAQDIPTIAKLFKQIILKSDRSLYGRSENKRSATASFSPERLDL